MVERNRPELGRSGLRLVVKDIELQKGDGRLRDYAQVCGVAHGAFLNPSLGRVTT